MKDRRDQIRAQAAQDEDQPEVQRFPSVNSVANRDAQQCRGDQSQLVGHSRRSTADTPPTMAAAAVDRSRMAGTDNARKVSAPEKSSDQLAGICPPANTPTTVAICQVIHREAPAHEEIPVLMRHLRFGVEARDGHCKCFIVSR
jgi:hypothetical protein